MTVSLHRITAGRAGVLLFLFSLFVARAATAQTSTISGRVVGEASAEPLADVQIRLERTSRGALTDADGRFVLGAVPPGAYVLLAQRLGLATQRRDIVIDGDASPSVELVERP